MKYLCWDRDAMGQCDAEEFQADSAYLAAMAFVVQYGEAEDAEDGDEICVMVGDPDGVRTKYWVTARAVMQYDAEELK